MAFKKGSVPWNKGIKRTDINGKKNVNWKGGSYISNDGYRMIKVADRMDVGAKWKCYAKEHKVVVERKLGRPLTKGEIVHHIDKDKLNNKLNNLYVTSQSKHRDSHDSLEKIAIVLYKEKLVTFNRKTGLYEISKELQKFLTSRKGPK